MKRELKTRIRICPSCKSGVATVDGQHLKELRKESGLALREVARRLGFTPAYICDIENNRRNPPQVMINFWKWDRKKEKGHTK